MLRPGLRRQVGRVGCQKRERRFIIPAVLGEVEVDAADKMPRRAPTLEKLLDRHLRFGELGSKRGSDLSPERFKDRGRDVLGAGHRRRGRSERFEFGERGRLYWRVVRIEIGMRANDRDKSSGEIAPVAQVRWKCGPHFGGAELEKSVPRATTEGGLDPAQHRARRL